MEREEVMPPQEAAEEIAPAGTQKPNETDQEPDTPAPVEPGPAEAGEIATDDTPLVIDSEATAANETDKETDAPVLVEPGQAEEAEAEAAEIATDDVPLVTDPEATAGIVSAADGEPSAEDLTIDGTNPLVVTSTAEELESGVLQPASSREEAAAAETEEVTESLAEPDAAEDLELAPAQPTQEEQTEIGEEAAEPVELGEAELKAILEAVIYITEEPLEPKQIAQALGQRLDRVVAALAQLVTEYSVPAHGLQIKEIAGGYKMATKPEYHDAVRRFVKNLKAPLKLTPAALETLAVIAYKQPITGPEIMEIRGVQGGSVLKTLLDRKLITTAGRKNVIGKPILYKTTKDFLLQFGLKGIGELPTLKEFEELRRLAFSDDEVIESPEGPSSRAEAVEENLQEAPQSGPDGEPDGDIKDAGAGESGAPSEAEAGASDANAEGSPEESKRAETAPEA